MKIKQKYITSHWFYLSFFSLMMLGAVHAQNHGIADPSNLFIELGKPDPLEYLKHGDSLYTNEYKIMLFGMFKFYKKFVSSQDANSCSFTPSCSVYALEAIEKQGVVMGWINFFDRFARCNGLSPEDYPVAQNKKLLIDPVKDQHNTMVE